jgi:hypothetical protein
MYQGHARAAVFKRNQGRIVPSYITEIFLKMLSIKAKSVKFDHPNKLVLTTSGDVLRKTLMGWAIYSHTFVIHLSFRMTKLQNKCLGIQINDLSLGEI